MSEKIARIDAAHFASDLVAIFDPTGKAHSAAFVLAVEELFAAHPRAVVEAVCSVRGGIPARHRGPLYLADVVDHLNFVSRAMEQIGKAP
jgi:hypothetical protein